MPRPRRRPPDRVPGFGLPAPRRSGRDRRASPGLRLVKPLELAVVGKPWRPLRKGYGEIRRRGVVEPPDMAGDDSEHRVDEAPGILGTEAADFAGRIAARQAPVFESRRLAAHPLETTTPGTHALGH